MDRNRMPVLVYGSLKRGSWNHDLIRRYAGSYVGEATTRDSCFDLAVIDPEITARDAVFPVVYRGRLAIKGELFLCTDTLMEAMDILEQAPLMYQRVVVDVVHPEYPRAWIYVGTDYLLDICVPRHLTRVEESGIVSWTQT